MTSFPYSTITLLSTDGSYYSVRLQTYNGVVALAVGQTPVTLGPGIVPVAALPLQATNGLTYNVQLASAGGSVALTVAQLPTLNADPVYTDLRLVSDDRQTYRVYLDLVGGVTTLTVEQTAQEAKGYTPEVITQILGNRLAELNKDDFLHLNGYNVQRIVYDLIKNYLSANPPADCGIVLAQKYDPDVTKSSIFLDVSYNWKEQTIDKLPAIYVQRGDIVIQSPTLGHSLSLNARDSQDTRLTLNTMPIKVSCVAAAPIAVVENLAEYVKQPLLYFRKEVEHDFRIRRFKLEKISTPAYTPEGKTNFYVDLTLDVIFDENWMITRDSLKLKTCQMIFDQLKEEDRCRLCNDSKF